MMSWGSRGSRDSSFSWEYIRRGILRYHRHLSKRLVSGYLSYSPCTDKLPHWFTGGFTLAPGQVGTIQTEGQSSQSAGPRP